MTTLRSLCKAANHKAALRESLRREVNELQFHLDALAAELSGSLATKGGKITIRRRAS